MRTEFIPRIQELTKRDFSLRKYSPQLEFRMVSEESCPKTAKEDLGSGVLQIQNPFSSPSRGGELKANPQT